jgi:hypothetical protein
MVKLPKKQKLIGIISLLVFFLAFNSYLALSQPKLPLEIYGTVRLFNAPVMPGTTIFAYDENLSTCGQFVVTNSGFFGTLSCYSEGTFQEGVGGSEGQTIRFRIGTFPASVLLDNSSETLSNIYEEINKLTWSSGEFKEVILVAPPLVCGDGFCDNFESCTTCPEDCGACPQPTPTPAPTQPTPPDFGAGMPGFGPQPPPLPEEEITEEECLESWSCSDWGPCLPSGVQYRDCIDLNQCGTTEERPETQRECTYHEREETEPIERERPKNRNTCRNKSMRPKTAAFRLRIISLFCFIRPNNNNTFSLFKPKEKKHQKTKTRRSRRTSSNIPL